MKRVRRVTVISAFLVGAAALAAENAPTRRHPALERLKSLEGAWAGPAVWDEGGKKGSVDFKVTYKVTAAGTVVTETMFPGTPGEMVSVYHADGDDLVMVHYCSSGNQPRMKLEPSRDPDDLAFRCVGGTNMTERDSHMHSARITVVDADHIKGAWSSTKDGALKWTAGAELTRQK